MLLRRKGRAMAYKDYSPTNELVDILTDGISNIDIRSYNIYYQILLGLVSQGILTSERMADILEFLDNIDADLEKIMLIKNTLSEFSFANYKKAGNFRESILGIIKSIDSDFNRIYLLKNAIMGFNFNYYKDTVRTLRSLIKN